MSPPITLAKRALHAGDHDHGVGAGDSVDVGEQAVQPGDADVVQAIGGEPVGGERDRRLVGHGRVGGAGGGDQHREPGLGCGASPQDAATQLLAFAVGGDNCLQLVRRRRG